MKKHCERLRSAPGVCVDGADKPRLHHLTLAMRDGSCIIDNIKRDGLM